MNVNENKKNCREKCFSVCWCSISEKKGFKEERLHKIMMIFIMCTWSCRTTSNNSLYKLGQKSQPNICRTAFFAIIKLKMNDMNRISMEHHQTLTILIWYIGEEKNFFVFLNKYNFLYYLSIGREDYVQFKLSNIFEY